MAQRLRIQSMRDWLETKCSYLKGLFEAKETLCVCPEILVGACLLPRLKTQLACSDII